MCKLNSSDPNEAKCCVCQICFLVCFLASIALLAGGFLMPPKGEIDGSVLTAVGELFLFPALAFGYRAIMAGMELHISHNGTSIDVSRDDDDDNNGKS